MFFAIAFFCLSIYPTAAMRSQYDITSAAPFNQPNYYPIAQSVSPTLYRPVGNWVGRLILPPVEQSQTDWVWMEVLHAPDAAKALIGQQVRLEWKPTSEVKQYVETVTRDVKFSPQITESLNKGNIHPTRLNQRLHVGPLQAIAGARPNDDVIVTLDRVAQTGKATLQIETEPVLEAGRFYGLVKILKSVPTQEKAFLPSDCPGSSPCPSELFQVQHYNPETKQFDGVQETIRVPQQPRDAIGVFASTSRGLENSPAGNAGWYIYGAQDQNGRFTVQALKPRSLFLLSPQQTIQSQPLAFDYLYKQNWKNTEQRQGTLQTTLIDLHSNQLKEGVDSEAGIAPQRALVMHIFGGRGGKSGEAPNFGTVSGHFSYGFAEIVRDPLTQELQWDVHYQQVYGTNIEGIISGTHSWANYMGNLRSGWMGTRPVNDVLVQLDVITQDYDFGGIKLSPFRELMQQLSIVAARYRIGDGTGAAVITPATSCVQDSNQALFITIQRLRSTVESNLAIQQWWSSHPQHPTIQRFQKLIALGEELEQQLTPLGIVRKDWKQNATALVGTQEFVHVGDGQENFWAAIASWRTILPRQAQDELSFLFLKYGAKLWLLRTNQIGGANPDIFPIAPTGAFANWTVPGTEIPVISILFLRLMSALRIPGLRDWLITIGLFGLCSAITEWMLFAQRSRHSLMKQRFSRYQSLRSIRQLFFPALSEELLFRVFLIPYPSPSVTWQVWGGWAALSLGLFVLYCFLTTKRSSSSFLLITTLLGLTCTVIFLATRSIITITIMHWLFILLYSARISKLYQDK